MLKSSPVAKAMFMCIPLMLSMMEKNVYTFRSHELYENNKITNEEKVTRKDMTFAELEPYFVGIRTLWANAVYYNKQ